MVGSQLCPGGIRIMQSLSPSQPTTASIVLLTLLLDAKCRLESTRCTSCHDTGCIDIARVMTNEQPHVHGQKADKVQANKVTLPVSALSF